MFSSKYHCVIVTKGDRVYLADAKSSNGTYVNGHAIEPMEPYLLKENDIIGIGVRGSFDRRHAVFRLIKVDDPQQEQNPAQLRPEIQLDGNDGFDEESICEIFALGLKLC
ncbi:hypothetical protein J437_LFUL004239 [Ladona fulva]|uniref:FHA domain-containing protein n=1 Tax=Ladona fulva TaxID=123851 RepID=A0A8K0K3H0_LADFU|nr:hypothetical protein J437_LFUL004239 [Ladona fulva]